MSEQQLWDVVNKLIIEHTALTPGEKGRIKSRLSSDADWHKEDWRAVDKALTWDSSSIGYDACYKAQVLWLLLFYKYLGDYKGSKDEMALYAQALYRGYHITKTAHNPTTDKILTSIIQSSGHSL